MARPVTARTWMAVAALLLACACACAGARTAPARDAEEAIRADALRADVAWLADPARTGRGVGTPGDAAAAAWIVERMRRAGLEPAGTDGFRQPFEAPVGARLVGSNALELGGRTLRLADEWQPFTFSDDGDVHGELVWAGYGISAPDLGYDDYAGVDVKGKVVVVAAHVPREADPSSPWRDPQRYHLGEWRYKAMNARDHGAAALLAVRDGWNHPGPDALDPWHGQVSSRAGIVAARVTLSALRAVGLDPAALVREDAPRALPLGVPAHAVVHVAHDTARTANVVGLLPGTDPRAGCVVVGAHHDHLGLGGESSLAPGVHAVHPGADDDASGVAAVLEIAAAMRRGPPPRRSVLFVTFGAEELGLLGSARLVQAPPAACPVEAVQLMLNLDMVGRPQDGKVYVQGASTAEGERERIEALAAAPPRIPLTLAFGGDGYGPSDHTSFHARGVPVVFLFTGAHADYHRPTDTADRIDPGGLEAVARLAYRTARAAADAPERYVAVTTPPPPGAQVAQGERAAGYGAYLGSIPDFGERTEPGVLVSAVRPGSPAAQAGIRSGDVLLRIGAAAIGNLQDLAYALRSHRAGDVVEVVWQRAAETLRAPVTLGERK